MKETNPAETGCRQTDGGSIPVGCMTKSLNQAIDLPPSLRLEDDVRAREGGTHPYSAKLDFPCASLKSLKAAVS